jgi:hypothetical protein
MNPAQRPPLLVHHTGFQPHIPFCLWQNRRSNPGRRLILLGDGINRVAGVDYRHEEVANYQDKNRHLIAAYRHNTDSEFLKERSHLERWFILSSFLEKSGINQFYFLDSDYLLFCSLAEHESAWLNHEAAGTPSFWGFCYFRTAEPVHQFCRWLLELYGQEDRFQSMLARCQAMGSGLQEMSYIEEYCREKNLSVAPLDWRHTSSPDCFDDCYYGCSYFDHPAGFRRLRQTAPGGHVLLETERGPRRLLGLHFQGHRKRHIPGFTGWSRQMVQSLIRPNYRRNIRHLCQYAWEGWRCQLQLRRSWDVSGSHGNAPSAKHHW